MELKSRILVFFLGLFISTPNYIKLNSGHVCNKKEIKSLITFKKDLKDPLSHISTWSGEGCCNNKTEIVELNLQNFMLGGELNNLNPSLQELKQLKQLDLSLNDFEGIQIPSLLGSLQNLATHRYPHVSFVNFTSLTILDLSQNYVVSPLPEWLYNLTSLVQLNLDTGYNSLEGVVTEAHFDNLIKLQIIEMDSLVLELSLRWIPPFQLISASFKNCLLGPHFPEWLQTQIIPEEIDLSITGIASTVPTWFWNMTSQFNYLNLSNNQITGGLPKLLKSGYFSAGIYLSSNQFTGQLRTTYIRELDLSNNSFSGSISMLLCDQVNANRLRVLDLSRNLLSGEIPQCWMYWSNNLTGNIPSSMGSLILLQSLHMRNNSLSGELPLSLQNCTQLRTMDLGENRFDGIIPT
ncbi:hypothetical protein MKX01_012892 [Papaver californicum]|nr:hypothetical protein MKX01_012892 [Papaver californicum]